MSSPLLLKQKRLCMEIFMYKGRLFGDDIEIGSTRTDEFNAAAVVNQLMIPITSIDGVNIVDMIGFVLKLETIPFVSMYGSFQIYEIDASNNKNGDVIYDKTYTADHDIIDGAGFYYYCRGLKYENSVGVGFFANSASTFHLIVESVRLVRHFNEPLNNPISIIEHCKYNQNWAGGTPLVKYSGAGSFLSEEIESIRSSVGCDREIIDYSQAWTDNVVKSLCEEFFLLSYQDESGYECIDYLFRTEENLESVVYGDTIGEIGEVEPPKIRDVFIKPIIKYGFDYATEKYSKSLSVNSVEYPAYSESFVDGFSGTDGYNVWSKCRDLYKRYKQIEENRESLIELKWCSKYEDALWVLNKRLDLMSMLRVSFSVAYTKGRKWHIWKHISINFPHETKNQSVECVIEKITKDKNKKMVSVVVLMLDSTEADFYGTLVQETINNPTSENWQEQIGIEPQNQEVVGG